MKKTMKKALTRLLSLVLAMAMTLSVCGLSAFAEDLPGDDTEASGEVQAETVEPKETEKPTDAEESIRAEASTQPTLVELQEEEFVIVEDSQSDDGVVASGTCGDNLTWTLEDGILTISGTGMMANYTGTSSVPWYPQRNTITTVIVEDGVTSIGDYAFFGCSELMELNLPESLTSLGLEVISGTSIVDLFIPKSVTDYSYSSAGTSGTRSTFKGSELTYVEFEEGTTTISDYALCLASNVTTVVIPDTVTIIGKAVFENCSLTNIDLPDGIISIGDYALFGCSELTELNLPESLTSLGLEVISGTSIVDLFIPKSVTDYSYSSAGTSGTRSTFKGSELIYVEFEEGTTTISDYALCLASNITTVVIPGTVTIIGNSSFGTCFSLTDVYYGSNEEAWNEISIGSDNECLTNATIHYKSIGPEGETIAIGDEIIFGNYEQDSDTTNGQEEIEWTVLNVQDGKALVISKYALDSKPYNEENESVTWETCTLRAWLNDEFVNSAFTETEQTAIVASIISNPDNVTYGTSGGNDTLDQVFLLSIDEAEEYFGRTSESYGPLAVYPTEYAKAQGAKYDKLGFCWWWLRSPGSDQNSAAHISMSTAVGGAYVYGVTRGGKAVYDVGDAIRPSMWIDIGTFNKIDSTKVINTLTFDEDSYSCNVGDTVSITAIYVSETSPDEITWTCSDEDAVTFSETSIQGPSVTGGENTYWISTAITGLTAGTATLTLSVFERSASVSITVNQKEYMGIGVLTGVDDNLDYIFINDDETYVAEDSEFTKMKELLNNKKISDKRVIFKYTDYNVIISIYSIYDVLCLQTKNVQTSLEKLEYSTDGTYQTDTIEVTADIFVTEDRSSNAPYSQSDIDKLKKNELYLNLKDVTLKACSTSNIVYFGKTLWMKTTKKEVETDVTTVRYGQNGSISITVSADIDNNAEPEEDSATVQIMKFVASVASDEYDIAFSDCSVKVINQHEVEKESALDALVKSYENADITIGLRADLNQYFADGSNDGADDVAVIEYIAKMLALETIASYNNAEDWAERLENLVAEKLRDKLLSKLGLSSSVIGGTDTMYAYAQYTGTNSKTIGLKIPVAIYMQGGKIYGGTGSIFYSTDGKNISDTHKEWNVAGTLTYVDMSNFADCMVNYVKITYNQAWGKSADKAAEYLIGQPLSNVFTVAKAVNNVFKVLDFNVKLPTSISDGIFKFSLNQAKKTASIECPVDVYVYNSSGQVCGAIENNAINPYFNDENVVLNIVGDKKYVALDNDDYCILFVGNDNGTMKYQIDEYADGELVRSVTTIDIPLEKGTVYCGYIPASLYTSAAIYELICEDEDETIPVTSDEYYIQDEVVDVTEHTEGEAVIENEVPATCIESGSYDSVVYCTVCGKELSRETVTVPATGHNYTYTDNGDSTHIKSCTTGDDTTTEKHTYIDGVCTLCRAEEPVEHVHVYEEPVFTWTDNYVSATATFTCVNGDDEQKVNCIVTNESTEPTCTEKGKTVYTATAIFESKKYTDSKTVNIPATGHSYVYTDNGEGTHTKSCIVGDDTTIEEHTYVDGFCTFCGAEKPVEHIHVYEDPVFTWSDDYTSAIATFTCVESDDQQFLDCTVTSKTTAATGKTDGQTVYTASVEFEGQIYTDTKTVVIPATGSVDPGFDHNYGWMSWFNKWFGDNNNPSEPETPDDGNTSEPEQPSNPSTPSKPSIWDWIKDFFDLESDNFN